MTVLDVYDPLSTQSLELTVTDPLGGGVPVTTAAVTVTVRDAAGAALAGLTDVPLVHVAQGLYRVLIPPATSAAAGITLASGRLVLDYTATISGSSPLVTTTTRQTVRVARTTDQ